MDKLFVKAITIAAKTETYYCVSMPAPEWSLSEETEKTILGYADRKEKKRLAPRQLIAILIAAALLVALSITAYAYREQIGNLIESIFDDHNEYTNGEKNYSDIETVVIPTYIPTDYTNTVSNISKSNVFLQWNKDSVNTINLGYNTLINGTIFTDTEGAIQEELTVDDNLIKIFVKHKTITAIWSDDSYAYVLTCPEELGLEEIEKIIRSIEPVENAGE